MPKSKEFVSSESGSDSDPEPQKKKKKTSKGKEKSPKKEPSKPSSSNGEVMIQLSKFRFASVSTFKGKKYVNIREYYEQDGELKPGRKGISLSPDQWTKLKDAVEEIDGALDE